MTTLSLSVPALCAWRENRGGLRPGMQSVLNVLANRAKRDNTTLYAEAVKRLQFSSMTALGDSQTILWPLDGDPQYATAEQMAQQALDGELPDLTQGATDYYAPQGIGPSGKMFTIPGGATVSFPARWDEARVKFTVEIAGQLFFREISA